MNWFEYEKEMQLKGYDFVCGVDEAGRGPLAGPVFAAAVILDENTVIDGLNDSKKLPVKKREALFDEICEKSLYYSIAAADEKTIDEINILQATFVAMTDAVKGLEKVPDMVLIDGNKVPPQLSVPAMSIVKGDALCTSIAAASILAKVSRDRFMLLLHERYPQYNFAKHKGYGTKLHYEMIEKYGISPVHRKSFLKKIIGEQ